MASYVILVNWTEEGVRTFRDTVERADSVAQLMQQLGGQMTNLYWTLGAYDLVAICEAPDDETATAASLAISSQGYVRTATMRAFTREEMTGILAKL
ncbi:MAG TPA: GYD domain-containing protein [Egibacteraceae bacterium]|nr:GYD domain-containing protein [Egibacteraceae bacterium]